MLNRENEKTLLRLADKQFSIIGEKMSFKSIPDDGIIEVKGKKIKWYNHYKFTEAQEKEWLSYLDKELNYLGQNKKKIKDFLELVYGFNIRYTKKGELF